MTEDDAWRRRIERKIDRLGYHVTLLALASRRPLLPSMPPPRPRTPLWPVLARLLASYLLPAIGTIVLLARNALGRLWEALLAAL